MPAKKVTKPAPRAILKNTAARPVTKKAKKSTAKKVIDVYSSNERGSLDAQGFGNSKSQFFGNSKTKHLGSLHRKETKNV